MFRDRFCCCRDLFRRALILRKLARQIGSSPLAVSAMECTVPLLEHYGANIHSPAPHVSLDQQRYYSGGYREGLRVITQPGLGTP